MPYAMKPIIAVSANNEQEAIEKGLPLLRQDVANQTGVDVSLVHLEPLLVLEISSGRWEVMADAPATVFTFVPSDELVI